MICPDCGAEYRDGFDRCADCDTPLVHPESVPAPTEVAEEEQRWTRLCRLDSETEARLIQGYLESEGIPCSFESLAFRAEPVTFGPLARVHLHVLEQDLERARTALAEVREANE